MEASVLQLTENTFTSHHLLQLRDRSIDVVSMDLHFEWTQFLFVSSTACQRVPPEGFLRTIRAVVVTEPPPACQDIKHDSKAVHPLNPLVFL